MALTLFTALPGGGAWKSRWGVLGAALLAAAFTAVPAHARSALLPPDPGFEASVRAADVIVEAEVLSGGPFRALIGVKRVLKGAAPKVCELEGYNSANGDTVHAGFATGGRYLLFLSRTGRAGVFATLTPSAPRPALSAGGVRLRLGVNLNISLPPAAMDEALGLMQEYHSAGKTPPRALNVIRKLWDANEMQQRYLAVALAGYVREKRAVALASGALRAKFLRLRLTAVKALGKIGSPQALAALRPLLNSRRATVAREAARALVERRDGASLEALLAWAKGAARKLAGLPKGDAQRAKIRNVLRPLFLWLDQEGPLRPPGRPCRDLLELARGKDQAVALDALYLLGTLTRKDQVQALIELADDPVYKLRREAELALFRATLHPARDLDELRAWWKRARASFSEETKRTVVEAAAQGLAALPKPDERSRLLSILRLAPGELALVSAAPLLMSARTAAQFDTLELTLWRTPLALPFLLERLGYASGRERRIALEGLVLLARRHARLRPLVKPFVRGALSDEYSSLRRSAAASAGRLEDPRALPYLIEALQGGGGYEASAAADAIYQLSARTLGHGRYEPSRELAAAAKRLQGWWDSLGPAQATWRPPFAKARATVQAGLLAPKDLERACLGGPSRPAGAALARLLERRGPDDTFWLKLLASKRLRDRAHGVLGLLGGGPEDVNRLAKLVEGPSRDGDLVRALAVVALASMKSPAGPAWLAAWLQGARAPKQMPWRRLATVALGLASGEPQSLLWLSNLVRKALAAEARKETGEDTELLRAALAALCVRADGTAALAAALASQSDAVRELAVRALAQRRYRGANPALLSALARAGRYTVDDLARVAAPLLQPADAAALRSMLLNKEDGARRAAALLLARRPELADSAGLLPALSAATQDPLPEVRARAAEVLGRQRAREAIVPLTLLLKDADREVRASAAEALGRIGEPKSCALAATEAKGVFPQLDPRWLWPMAVYGGDDELAFLLKLSRSSSASDQRAGIEYLGYCARPKALARLLRVFHDDQSPFQTLAGKALEAQGEAAVAALKADVDSEKSATRARAIHLLAHVPTRSSAELLIHALGDAQPPLRALADWALRRLSGGKDAHFDPNASPAQRADGKSRWRALLQGLSWKKPPRR